MERIETEKVTFESVANKVNEIIECLNAIVELNLQETEMKINLITYGKYMTDEKVISDMKSKLGFVDNDFNADNTVG